VKVQSRSSRALPSNQENHDQWAVITPGERFLVRVSSEETNGAYTMLDLAAEHRNGTPMHIHQNMDEHFIILQGSVHLVYGDKTLDA
jgi:mannose-6-phosphate isomerase-like protein (cupin superfamily)